MKKKSWVNIKEILFLYLAANKVMDWMNTASTARQGDLEGVGEAILIRVLNRDIILIVPIIIIYSLDKFLYFNKESKYSNALKELAIYAIGYVAMIGFLYIYHWILSWFSPTELPRIDELVNNTIAIYTIITIALIVKLHFKRKKEEDPDSE